MPKSLKQQFDDQSLANGYEFVDGVAMSALHGEQFQILHPILKKHVGTGHFVEVRIDSPRFSVHEGAPENARALTVKARQPSRSFVTNIRRP